MDFEPSSILEEDEINRPQVFKINPSRQFQGLEKVYSEVSKVPEESKHLNVKCVHFHEISAVTLRDKLQDDEQERQNETFISILDDLKDVTGVSELDLTDTTNHTKLETSSIEFPEFNSRKKRRKHYQRILKIIREEHI
jgi:hypothetical protein